MNNEQLYILYQFIGPLMEPKPKQLAYRNVVSDPIIMPERGNRSKLVMPKRGNRSKLVMPERGNRSI